MKTWVNPEVIELEISATAHGQDTRKSWDDIRQDQNGNTWVSFQSGNCPTVITNPDPIYVP